MTKQSSFHERRLTVRLLAYWEKLRRGRLMPVEEDIDPDHIGDLWDNCFLVHVQDLGKPDYNFTYLGEAISEAYRGTLAQSEVEGLVSPNAERLAESYAKIIETRKPLVDEGEFYNYHNDLVKYRQCLLPLGNDHEVVAIFGGMRFKIYPAK